jgi:ribosomal protein S18 acetylase RimI-like enzyme
MNVTVRPATQADQEILRDVLYWAIFVPPNTPPLPRDVINHPDLSAYVDRFGTQTGDIGVIVESDGQHIGAAWVRLMRGYGFVDAETPELTIAVLPAYRNRGIGSGLLRELFALTDKTYPKISLSVQVANPAHRLYRRFGFAVVAEQDGTYTMVSSASDSIV